MAASLRKLNAARRVIPRKAFLKRLNGWFANVKQAPPDAIFGVTTAWKNDSNPKKINLGVGAYRDDNGKPWVLPSVRKAEELVFKDKPDHEYLPMSGLADFHNKAAQLAFGADSPVIKDKRNATVQTLSGTGALRVGGSFLGQHWDGNKEIWFPDPTWANHNNIFSASGLKIKKYRYFDRKTNGLDLCGLEEDIAKIPEKSIILIHACAHNPTGVDPTPEQWGKIADLVEKQCLLPFIDFAYQGFASGDVDRDAAAVRCFASKGMSLVLAQSFAKNMGLYGERTGVCTVVCNDSKEAVIVKSQVENIIRGMYSNPPVYGARIASKILNDESLYKIWLEDIKTMACRVIDAREQLKSNLVKLGSKHNWDHITNQIGMFCYTGLTKENVETLKKKFSIYMTLDGRISMAGVTSKNVGYLAEGMHAVTSGK